MRAAGGPLPCMRRFVPPSASPSPAPLPPLHCPPPEPGTEPRGLYNCVIFLLHDRGGQGRVTLEEAMKLTYLRVGKARRC